MAKIKKSNAMGEMNDILSRFTVSMAGSDNKENKEKENNNNSTLAERRAEAAHIIAKFTQDNSEELSILATIGRQIVMGDGYKEAFLKTIDNTDFSILMYSTRLELALRDHGAYQDNYFVSMPIVVLVNGVYRNGYDLINYVDSLYASDVDILEKGLPLINKEDIVY